MSAIGDRCGGKMAGRKVWRISTWHSGSDADGGLGCALNLNFDVLPPDLLIFTDIHHTHYGIMGFA